MGFKELPLSLYKENPSTELAAEFYQFYPLRKT